jgi:hypothetical protein
LIFKALMSKLYQKTGFRRVYELIEGQNVTFQMKKSNVDFDKYEPSKALFYNKCVSFDAAGRRKFKQDAIFDVTMLVDSDVWNNFEFEWKLAESDDGRLSGNCAHSDGGITKTASGRHTGVALVQRNPTSQEQDLSASYCQSSMPGHQIDAHGSANEIREEHHSHASARLTHKRDISDRSSVRHS